MSQGNTGEQGIKGEQGQQGERGVQGSKGLHGERGITGLRGGPGNLVVTVDDPETRRNTRIGLTLLVSLLLNTITLSAVGFLAYTGRVTTRNTQALVKQIDKQTSPESIEKAAASQKIVIDDVLRRSDCSQRLALEDALDQLVEQGVLRTPIKITEICSSLSEPKEK